MKNTASDSIYFKLTAYAYFAHLFKYLLLQVSSQMMRCELLMSRRLFL